MDPLTEAPESRSALSPAFFLDGDEPEYYAFHDLNIDQPAPSAQAGTSNQQNQVSFEQLLREANELEKRTGRPVNRSPESINTTPILTHDEDDADDDDDVERYMAEHFDFESATTVLADASTIATAQSTNNITIRNSDSDSSIFSVKRNGFSYPPSPKSFSSQKSAPAADSSTKNSSVRAISPPQHSPLSTPPPLEDESVYAKPLDWSPPEVMPDFDPLDWLSQNTKYQLSVATDTLKSRVETQIKAVLTFRPSPTEQNMHLPTSTIAKARQQLKKPFSSDPKTLELDAIVVCDHNRYKYINVCLGCMKREHKRASRKKLPSADDTHWLESQDNRGIMFNCAELLEIPDPKNTTFAAQENSLNESQMDDNMRQLEIPIRIPCYCRHHAEKTGFRVYFVIKDHTGQVVARTFTEPIMITDDHKTSNANARRKAANTAATQPASSTNVSDDSLSGSPTNEYGFSESANPRKRKMSPRYSRRAPNPMALNAESSRPTADSQRLSVPGAPSGSVPAAAASSASTQPKQEVPFFRAFEDANFTAHSHSVESFGFPAYSSNTPLSLQQPREPAMSSHASSPMSNPSPLSNISTPESSHSVTPATASARRAGKSSTGASANLVPPSSMTASAPPADVPSLQRLIPTEGPIRGGIEVTMLGSGFRQGLTVMFGEQPAVKTHIWNESTIVAILPPAATSGPVVVRLKSLTEVNNPLNESLKLFTYIDDTDRQLMELALQVIGLKMTGRLEDARQIAMRIVQQTGSGGDAGNSEANIMAATTASSTLELTLLKCLDLVDYNESPHKVQWQLQNSSGQSMLHLSAFLGFQRLVAALLARGASYKLKDHAGFTPLHCATLRGHREIVQRFLNCGADPLSRSSLGYTSIDLATDSAILKLLKNHVANHISEASIYPSRSSRQFRRRLLSNDNAEDFPDWPSSSGPSSPAESMSDSYPDSLDDEASDATPENKEDDESRGWSRRRFFLRAGRQGDSSPTDKAKQLQLRLAEYLSQIQGQAFRPNWDSANHFMHDAFTSFASVRPTLANIATNIPAHSRRALENSWFGDYIASAMGTGAERKRSMGAAGAPPSYEEIYPESSYVHPSVGNTVDVKTAEASSVNVEEEPEPKLSEQEMLLKFWQNKKKKQMRNDLMLFAFWLPVLLVVLCYGAMSMFGIQISELIPIPDKLVEFFASRATSLSAPSVSSAAASAAPVAEMVAAAPVAIAAT
ncbi:hypothetical protein BZA70DRAFT_258964 [Myxozyma melibiosi]|uniref:IPT/TIG domain-containing protein n=1 Tax=Myxozyma melibiosi TaxID=54550 RepID=A0ABR1F2D1_9ASCO